MNNDNNNMRASNNTAIIQTIGAFIKQTRIRQNITQEELAAMAGVNRTTLYYFEKGQKGTLDSFVRLLRALDKLDLLESFLPSNNISPLAMIKMQERIPKRVGRKKQHHQ